MVCGFSEAKGCFFGSHSAVGSLVAAFADISWAIHQLAEEKADQNAGSGMQLAKVHAACLGQLGLLGNAILQFMWVALIWQAHKGCIWWARCCSYATWVLLTIALPVLQVHVCGWAAVRSKGCCAQQLDSKALLLILRAQCC